MWRCEGGVGDVGVIDAHVKPSVAGWYCYTGIINLLSKLVKELGKIKINFCSKTSI